MPKVILIAENLRSSHNVGSLLRSADGLGLEHVYLTGYTPYPPGPGDKRLPHEQKRTLSQIQKTSLGAETAISWSHNPDTEDVLKTLKKKNYVLAALEQTKESVRLDQFMPGEKIGLVVGNEITGVSPETMKLCDVVVEIPMRGKKESFNVTIAAAIALYHLITS